MRLSLLLFGILTANPVLATARFALVAGNNRGSPERARLWYAERDAERLSRALVELGDFPQSQVVVQRAATVQQVTDGFATLERGIESARAKGEQTLLVVFFSGHARTDGLELGSETLTFTDLKARIEASHADVKVAIVDACEAGTLTQVKGVKVAPELNFPLPQADSARGVAYIASTAVGEAAQESARLGGSFFTVHLETALRGAADIDGDGKVTLAEAFQYTSSRTVAGTSATEQGPQHPTYNFKMSGRGDVVLADLRRAEATLALPGDSTSSYVLSTRDGVMFAESHGGVTLALPKGVYRVDQRSKAGLARGEFNLRPGDTVVAEKLSPVEPEPVRRKGDGRSTELFLSVDVANPTLQGSTLWPAASVGARLPLGRWGLRAALEYQPSQGESLGLSWALHRISVVSLLVRSFSLGAFRLELGPLARYGVSLQSLPNARTFISSDLGVGLGAGLFLPWGPLLWGLAAQGQAHFYRLNGGWQVGPEVRGGLMVAYEL